MIKIPLQHAPEIEFKHSSGSGVKFGKQAKCPKCEVYLRTEHVIQDVWPYNHGDYLLICPKCKDGFLFGIPVTPNFDGSMHPVMVWDSAPMKVLPQAYSIVQPVCPFHNKKMEIKKVWGDTAMVDKRYMRVQWKCPEWFLTAHLTAERKIPSDLLETPKATENKKKILSRIRKLGYIE